MALDEGWKSWAEMLISKLTALDVEVEKVKTAFYDFRREFEKDHLHSIEDQGKSIDKLIEAIKEMSKLDLSEIAKTVKQHESYIIEQQAIEVEQERSTKAVEKVEAKSEKSKEFWAKVWQGVIGGVITATVLGAMAGLFKLMSKN